MLDALQAKKLFRQNLALLLVSVFWPIAGGLLTALIGGFNILNFGQAAAIMAVIWLALIIFLIVRFWMSAQHVSVTPWASLWILVPVWGVFITAMMFLEPLKYIADDKPQNQRLPLTWPMIKDSVEFYFKNIPNLIKTSVWMLYVSLGIGVATFLATLWSPFAIILIATYIVAIGLSVWIGLRLTAETAAYEAGNKPAADVNDWAKNRIWPNILMALMMFAILFLPLIGSFILAAIGYFTFASGTQMFSGILSAGQGQLPSLGAMITSVIAFAIFFILILVSYAWILYKANQFTFANLAFVIDGKPVSKTPAWSEGYGLAKDALNESVRIAKRRWWGVYWKNQLMGLTIGLCAAIVIQMSLGMVTGILLMALPKNQIGQALNMLLSMGVQGAAQMLMMPLVLGFQVKLYRAF